MQIIPEIYVYQGKAVSLYKASFDEMQIYSKTPIDLARSFAQQGATSVLLIDMDRSINGSSDNEALIKQIKDELNLQIFYTGGIREIDLVYRLLKLGVAKVILGVSAEPIFNQAVTQFGSDKIIAGIKAKRDEVITDKELKFPLRVIDYAEKLPQFGFKYILYKDIFKQGTQIGPNYDEPDRILRMTPLKVYTSGGVSKKKHLDLLKEIGVLGVGIGKAFHERELNLSDCINQYQSA